MGSNMMRTRCVAVLAALSLASAMALWSEQAHAQCASLTSAGTASTENFDSLSSTVASGVAWTDNATVPNWYSTRTTYNVATGSSNAGALYSFGIAGTNAVTDRALGGIGSGGTGTFHWAGCFINNTGAELASVDIAYVGEQWRDGGNATNVAQPLVFQYQVANAGVISDANTPTTGWLNVAALDFSSPIFTITAAALDGNAMANRTAKSANIPVGVAVGQQIWIRWQDINDTGNDHGLAIDDVSATGVAVPAVAAADLTVTLADNPDPVVAGANLTYFATLTNNGPADAADATISLPLPATLTMVSVVSSAGATCTAPAVGANGTVSCTWAGATATGPGNARTVTVVARVPANTASGFVFNAQTTVTSTTADPTPGNNLATTGTGVITAANLTMALTDSPDPVIAGNQLTYLATLTNVGPSDAQAASITLPLPVGTTFVSVMPSAGGACNAVSPVVCTWAGATAPAGVRSATIVALVAPATSGPLSATATAASTTTDPVPGNNTANAATAVNISADLSVILTGSPNPVTAGTNLTYAATLSNGGPSDAQNVAVSLPLPTGTGFVSADPGAGGTCTTPTVGAGGTISCSWTGATAASVPRVLSAVVAVAASATGTLNATATASSSSPDTNTANNTSMVSSAVTGSADLALTFTSSPAQVTPGLAITFVANVTNNGPSDAQTVQISVALGAAVQFFSVSTSAGGACTSPSIGSTGTVVCTFAGATMPGGMRSVTVTAYSYRNGSVGASASASSATSDPTPDNNAASSNVVVAGAGGSGTPILIPTANNAVLALLATLLGLLGFAAVRRRA